MRKRNTKRQKRIVLFIRCSIFVIAFCMLFLWIVKKNVFQPPISSAKENTQETLPKSNIISLQGISQDGIPTGCESVSTVAVLQHLGIDITANKFIDKFLPCEKFYKKEGMVYGADPDEAFAGDPYETASLGCYPNVILKALNKMKKSGYPGMNNLTFKNVSGTDLETLATQYIANQIPVIIWVTINMKPSYEGMQYCLEDGSLYTWTAPEHCVVLCGYDDDSYYIMDPLENGKTVAYPKTLVEQRYHELSKYALVISSDSL